MKATRLILAAMVFGIAGASQANAQCSGNAGSCTTTNTASVTVGALVKLGMTTTTTLLTAPTADDIDAGNQIENVGPVFSIKANRSWTLKIKTSNGTNWTYVSGGNSGVKPIGHLGWALASGGSYTPITNADVTFTSGAGATNTGAATAWFRTTWLADFTDASNRQGVYELPIVFTLTAP